MIVFGIGVFTGIVALGDEGTTEGRGVDVGIAVKIGLIVGIDVNIGFMVGVRVGESMQAVLELFHL